MQCLAFHHRYLLLDESLKKRWISCSSPPPRRTAEIQAQKNFFSISSLLPSPNPKKNFFVPGFRPFVVGGGNIKEVQFLTLYHRALLLDEPLKKRLTFLTLPLNERPSSTFFGPPSLDERPKSRHKKVFFQFPLLPNPQKKLFCA